MQATSPSGFSYRDGRNNWGKNNNSSHALHCASPGIHFLCCQNSLSNTSGPHFRENKWNYIVEGQHWMVFLVLNLTRDRKVDALGLLLWSPESHKVSQTKRKRKNSWYCSGALNLAKYRETRVPGDSGLLLWCPESHKILQVTCAGGFLLLRGLTSSQRI